MIHPKWCFLTHFDRVKFGAFPKCRNIFPDIQTSVVRSLLAFSCIVKISVPESWESGCRNRDPGIRSNFQYRNRKPVQIPDRFRYFFTLDKMFIGYKWKTVFYQHVCDLFLFQRFLWAILFSFQCAAHFIHEINKCTTTDAFKNAGIIQILECVKNWVIWARTTADGRRSFKKYQTSANIPVKQKMKMVRNFVYIWRLKKL
jgi:hypothetical protein